MFRRQVPDLLKPFVPVGEVLVAVGEVGGERLHQLIWQVAEPLVAKVFGDALQEVLGL